jgi:hypothetical protein
MRLHGVEVELSGNPALFVAIRPQPLGGRGGAESVVKSVFRVGGSRLKRGVRPGRFNFRNSGFDVDMGDERISLIGLGLLGFRAALVAMPERADPGRRGTAWRPVLHSFSVAVIP